MRSLSLIGLCTLFSVLASVFLKRAAQGLDGVAIWPNLLLNTHVWLGAIAYAAAFLVYLYTLRTVPLSLVQPTITAGVSVVTAIAAVAFFRESMATVNWLGLLFVSFGIFLLFYGRT